MKCVRIVQRSELVREIHFHLFSDLGGEVGQKVIVVVVVVFTVIWKEVVLIGRFNLGLM